MLRTCLSPGGVYADTLTYAQGSEELAAVMEGLQAKMAGARFVVDTFIAHHDRALVHWSAVDGEGTVRFPGIDAVIFAPDHRLVQISGFF